jgi:hypothetical protein
MDGCRSKRDAGQIRGSVAFVQCSNPGLGQAAAAMGGRRAAQSLTLRQAATAESMLGAAALFGAGSGASSLPPGAYRLGQPAFSSTLV